jgi:hypothetical protein
MSTITSEMIWFNQFVKTNFKCENYLPVYEDERSIIYKKINDNMKHYVEPYKVCGDGKTVGNDVILVKKPF